MGDRAGPARAQKAARATVTGWRLRSVSTREAEALSIDCIRPRPTRGPMNTTHDEKSLSAPPGPGRGSSPELPIPRRASRGASSRCSTGLLRVRGGRRHRQRRAPRERRGPARAELLGRSGRVHATPARHGDRRSAAAPGRPARPPRDRAREQGEAVRPAPFLLSRRTLSPQRPSDDPRGQGTPLAGDGACARGDRARRPGGGRKRLHGPPEAGGPAALLRSPRRWPQHRAGAVVRLLT